MEVPKRCRLIMYLSRSCGWQDGPSDHDRSHRVETLVGTSIHCATAPRGDSKMGLEGRVRGQREVKKKGEVTTGWSMRAFIDIPRSQATLTGKFQRRGTGVG